MGIDSPAGKKKMRTCVCEDLKQHTHTHTHGHNTNPHTRERKRELGFGWWGGGYSTTNRGAVHDFVFSDGFTFVVQVGTLSNRGREVRCEEGPFARLGTRQMKGAVKWRYLIQWTLF